MSSILNARDHMTDQAFLDLEHLRNMKGSLTTKRRLEIHKNDNKQYRTKEKQTTITHETNTSMLVEQK